MNTLTDYCTIYTDLYISILFSQKNFIKGWDEEVVTIKALALTNAVLVINIRDLPYS